MLVTFFVDVTRRDEWMDQGPTTDGPGDRGGKAMVFEGRRDTPMIG